MLWYMQSIEHINRQYLVEVLGCYSGPEFDVPKV